MMTVTVSPKFQVVIPQSVRKALGIKAGMKFHVFQYENRIEFIPKMDIKKMRGSLPGIDTTVEREPDRL
jgi:AbrB family looped-hinge helix DNA binding protein